MAHWKFVNEHPQLPDERYVSRVEFSSFERNVRGQFDDVLGRIDSVGRKIDGFVSRGTDWRSIIGALGVFASLMGLAFSAIMAVGGIIAWGLTTQDTFMREDIQSIEQSIVTHQRNDAATNATHSERMAGIYNQLDLIEKKLEEVK